jgi:hypothetical protein
MTGLVDGERREARRNGEPMSALDPDREVQRVVVSRNDYERHRIHLQLPWDVYPCGSAVVKLAHAADGSADVYFSTGPRSIWDVAGGTAVLEAIGALRPAEHVDDDGRTAQLIAECSTTRVYLCDWPRNRRDGYASGVTRVRGLGEVAMRMAR